MLVDIHSHVNSVNFKDDADEVIRRALDNDTWMVLAGVDYKSSVKALNYANKYQRGVYATVGLHPENLEGAKVDDEAAAHGYSPTVQGETFYYDSYEKLAKFEKVVAIGEIGLDYYQLDPARNIPQIKQKQQEVLLQQLLLARQLDLPVVIHCRQAHDDLLLLLQDFKKVYGNLIPSDRPWGVIHCFSGDADLAWQYFSLGFLISFTGLITFSQSSDELIRKVPLDKIMIETDAPYMTPEPYRGHRNEPVLVQYVAKRIAEIKDLKLERIAEATTETARSFFRI